MDDEDAMVAMGIGDGKRKADFTKGQSGQETRSAGSARERLVCE